MEEFLKEFGDYYGYPDGPKSITEIRETEFKRLNQGFVTNLLVFLLFLESCMSSSQETSKNRSF